VATKLATLVNKFRPIATLSVFALGLAVFTWPFLTPIDSTLPALPNIKYDEKASAKKSWKVEDFQALWDKRLLPPPPPRPIAQVEHKPEATIQSVPPTPPPLKLVSILYSQEAKVAVFSVEAGGQSQTVRLVAGETAVDCELLRIERRQVEVKYQGRTFTLSLEQ
jgi:hypothetical protein